MHGTSIADKEYRRFAFWLPGNVFLQLPDQCFQARRSYSPARNRGLVTTFHSPATAAAFAAAIPGSTFPAYYFAS